MKLFYLLSCLVLSVILFGKSESYSQSFNESVIQLNSVEVLIKDSEFNKANKLFKSIKVKDLSPIDQVRLFFFKGMISFENKDYKTALDNYKKSYDKINYLSQGIKNLSKPSVSDSILIQNQNEYKKSIETFMAQSYFALKKYESAISILNYQNDRNEKSYLILSSSYWELNKKDQAFVIINSALKKYPRSASLIKQKAIYFSEIGLLHELYLEANLLLKDKNNFDENYFLFLINLLKIKNEILLAQKNLEEAILIYPNNANLTSELAYLYYSQNKVYPAKELYLKAAQIDKKFSHQAAEVLLKNNELVLAKYYNSFIADQKKKIKQLFAIEIKMSNFEEAYFLKDELNRQGLLNDESLVYALAYCAIKVGQIEDSSKLLNQIKSPEMFKKALKLKDWSSECLSEGSWKCVI